MYKSAVYHGNTFMGEVEIHPQNNWNLTNGNWAAREIRVSRLSPPSERCPPLAVLHTIAASGLRFKMESRPSSTESPLLALHSACLRENKTAIVLLGEDELHLVAMSSRKNLMPYPCFWGFTVPQRLYDSCLVMLNLRCLGIVFDLDETLIVANTMRSFEDRIDALQKKLTNESDPQRIAGILAEIKRYQDDKVILKQYLETDQVVHDGKVYIAQSEIVPPLSESHQLITRPIIRLQEKNITLTRVNPAVRDTSVLVRLRPAWEELRNYLTARGRKRFEVYVCTMAERDYALEMWRLLDPEANLINSNELLDRIVCVKSGLRKSLLNVFQDGTCHPKMALVIDDRLKVWDEKDQPRVHVVPAFAPYFAPQAEATNSIPVLCVARNVACNVRGGFFKEFDEGLLPQISNVIYEDEITDVPSAPDVGNYLISEEETHLSNGNRDPLPIPFEGMTDVEAGRRLKGANFNTQIIPPSVNILDPSPISSVQRAMPSSSNVLPLVTQSMMPLHVNNCSQPIPVGKSLAQVGFTEPSLQGSPAREEGEVPESELDPDTRRRLLILQHGQDTREAPPPPPPPTLPIRPLQVSGPPVQPLGKWMPLNGEISPPRQLKRAAKEFPMEREPLLFNRKRAHNPSFSSGGENTVSERNLNGYQQYPARYGNGRLKSNHPVSNYSSSAGVEKNSSRTTSDVELDPDYAAHIADTPAGVLQEIIKKCGSKVEYRTALPDTTELQFAVEVWLVGEKIAEGIGRTRKDAQCEAAEKSLTFLANKYLSDVLPDFNAVHGGLNKLLTKDKVSVNDTRPSGSVAICKEDPLSLPSSSEESLSLNKRLEGPKASPPSVLALKDLCTMEGFNLVFQVQPSPASASRGQIHAQVEIEGQILGKGSGATWEDAKLQAAEEALGTLKSMLGQFAPKQSSSPRSQYKTSNKQFKAELSHVQQRSLSSSR